MSGSPCRSLFDTASESDSSYSISTAATSVHRFSIPASIAEHEDDDQECAWSHRGSTQFISTGAYDRHHRHQKALPQTPTMNGRPASDWCDGDQYWRLFPCPPATLPTKVPHWWEDAPSRPVQPEEAVGSEAAWDDSASCVDEMISNPTQSDAMPEKTQQDVVDDLRRQVQRLQLALDLQALQMAPASPQTVAHPPTLSLDERKRMKPSLLYSTLSFAPSIASSSSSTSSSSQATIKPRAGPLLGRTTHDPSMPRSHRTWVVNSTSVGSRSADEALLYQPRLSSISSDRRSSLQYTDSCLSPPLPSTPTPASSMLSDDILAKSESPLPSVPMSKSKIAVTRFVSALKPSPSGAHDDSDTQVTRLSWSHKHTGKMEVPKVKKLRQGPGRGRTIIKSPPSSGKVPIQS